MGGPPNVFERFVAALIALAAAVVRALIEAPARGWRRLMRNPVVREARAEEVVDLRHRVLRPGKPRETAVWEGDVDPETHHWVVDWAGEIVGCVTVMPHTEPTHPEYRWQLRGMATSPEVRGKGLGVALLRRVQQDVAAPMWCNARDTAVGFYAANGWEARGDAFDIPRIGPHRRMYWAPSKNALERS